MTIGDLIMIGGSAGSVEAIRAVLGGLGADLPAAVAIVIHVSPTSRSHLPEVLSRYGVLPVRHPIHGERIENGLVVVAPPDRHLVIEGDRILLGEGPRENGFRPSIDVMFRSAAATGTSRLLAIALSGALDDGAIGALRVKKRGGAVIVQDPHEAAYSGIPRAVLSAVPSVDAVLRAADIASAVHARLGGPGAVAPARSPRPNRDVEAPSATGLEPAPPQAAASTRQRGGATGLTCPECHGALWLTEEGDVVRFECRVGHGFTEGALLAAQQNDVEDAMWIAYRALEEMAESCAIAMERAGTRGHDDVVKMYEERRSAAMAKAEIIRRALTTGG